MTKTTFWSYVVFIVAQLRNYECNHKDVEYEGFPIFALPVNPSASRQHVGEIFKSEIKGIESNLATCPKCNKKDVKVTMTKSVITKELPKYLIIQLLRYQYDRNTSTITKIEKQVESGDLDRRTNNIYINIEDTRYLLKATIFHTGPETSSGHYTSIIKKDNFYYHINDDDVSEINTSEDLKFVQMIKSHRNYLLFYEKS